MEPQIPDQSGFSQAITPELSAQLEAYEVGAWLDMYKAAPADFVERFGLEIIQHGKLVLTRCPGIPFVHFNCIKNLGMAEPASQTQLDEAIALYREADIARFTIYNHPLAQPVQIPEWLEARGLHTKGGWDRIYRNGAPLKGNVLEPPLGFAVEKVTTINAQEWAGFIDQSYGLPTSPWLLALVERPGWHHYLLRHNGRVVAVRSMYAEGGMAWFGVEAPVPGIMAPSFDLDIQLCQAMVREGLELGVQHFWADIEAPTPEMNTPAYGYFAALGFKRPYLRSHYRP